VTVQRLKFVRFDHIKRYQRPDGNTERIIYDLYQCVCGNRTVARRRSVQSPIPRSTFSCGCLRKENCKRLTELGLNKHQGNKGKTGKIPHNKGKIAIFIEGRKRFVSEQELEDIYYGKKNKTG